MPRLARSSDAVTWILDPVRADLFHANRPGYLDRYVIHGLYRHTDTLVAVGADEAGDASRATAAAWYSRDDGVSWHRGRVAHATDALMEAVTWTGRGWLAVGANGVPGLGAQLGRARGPAVWASPDGNAWRRVDGTPTDIVAIATSIVALPHGGFLAGGQMVPHEAPGGPLWFSADAVTWQRVRDLQMTHAVVAILNAGAVVAGATPEFEATVATTTNGRTWSTDGLAGLAPPSSGVFAVVQTGATLVAVGDRAISEDAYGIALWTSSAGHAWVQRPTDSTFDNAAVLMAVVSGGVIAIFGRCDQDSASGQRNCVWSSRNP
jgi:hypothetical protein